MLCTRWLRDAGYDPVQLLALLDVVNHEVRGEGEGGGRGRSRLLLLS